MMISIRFPGLKADFCRILDQRHVHHSLPHMHLTTRVPVKERPEDIIYAYVVFLFGSQPCQPFL